MFVTLCVVREAAPSVPVCEGSDQRFCMFEPIHYELRAPYIPADYSQKEQPSDTCFVLFFSPQNCS